MTPDAVIEHFKQGNLRFRENRPAKHDYLAQKRNSIAGQYPAAVILSCIDSRAPAEIVLDAGIGETFNSRVAGNISKSERQSHTAGASPVPSLSRHDFYDVLERREHELCDALPGRVESA
nr:carbonic anhydrase [Salmonella enterica]